MKALIFGHAGFVGTHLEQYLMEQEMDCYGFDLKDGQDIRDYEEVRMELDRIQPDLIFHLAAMPFVAESNTNPFRAVDLHIKGTLNILEAVRQLGLRPKILLASTSEEYGYEEQTRGITETSPLRSTTMYGATKSAMGHIARVYTKQYGHHIVITRAFNHIGPGKGGQYADTSFARQIVQIERGEAKILRHGNLETVRNYVDVRDIVRAYAAAIHATPGFYNVCSDNNVSMARLLDMMIAEAGCHIITEVDEHLYRPGTSTFYAPSGVKLKMATGWQPQISFQQSVSDVVNDWRGRLL